MLINLLVMKTRFLCLLLFACLFSIARGQDIPLQGVVYGSDQEPLPGVNVMVKGASKGTVTDVNGDFLLYVPKDGTIDVSYIGFVTQSISVRGKKNLKIVLLEDGKLLEEVIVVGYGAQKKSEISGSIVSIDADKIAKQSTVSVAEMLRGQASGVHITQGNARPGGNANITIRGTRSLNGGNDPLFVLDGIPVSNIDNVNAADIASIEVLKDASSTAIYGARAANGVILVNTKRATGNALLVSVSAQMSVRQLKKNFDLYSPEEWADLRREAVRTKNGGVYPTDEQAFSAPVRQAMANNHTVDWMDLMLNNSVLQKYDVSVQSGTEKTKYLFSVGYLNEDGMTDYADFNRINFRQNIEHQLLGNVKIGSNIAYSISEQNVEDQSWDGFYAFLRCKPYATLYNEKGELNYILGEDNETNPLWNLRESSNNTKTTNLFANAFGEWSIIKGLKYRLNLSINTQQSVNKFYQSNAHQQGKLSNGLGSINDYSTKDFLIENIISYEKELFKGHKLEATFVQSANEIRYENLKVKGQDFAYGKFEADGIKSAASSSIEERSIAQRRILSYMGRIRYNISDKYLATFTMRADGASVFGLENKWGYFPSGSLMWRMSKENFLQDAKFIDDLKLRVSYGVVGNQAIDPYYSLGMANLRQRVYFNNGQLGLGAGFLPSSALYNPSLKWETSTSTNLGLDFSFLKSRITGSIEFYDTRTRDLLVDKSISGVLGYASQRVNLGEVKNQGIEMMLSFTPIRMKDVEWNIGVIFSRNKNELVKIDGKVDNSGEPVNDEINKWFIGESVNVYYDYQFEGIWQNTDQAYMDKHPGLQAQAGDVRVTDFDENGVIDNKDKVIYNRDPKCIASLNTSIRYKTLDLALDFYGAFGQYRYNSFMMSDLTGSGNSMKVNYWTPENPSNDAPRPRESGMNNPYLGTLCYQKSSYLRLRNITLGYSLPTSITKRTFLKSLRVHASLENFFTFTSYKSFSPESTPGDYPEPRTIQFGLNVTL